MAEVDLFAIGADKDKIVSQYCGWRCNRLLAVVRDSADEVRLMDTIITLAACKSFCSAEDGALYRREDGYWNHKSGGQSPIGEIEIVVRTKTLKEPIRRGKGAHGHQRHK